MSRFSDQIRDRLRDVASTVLLRHQTSDALFAVLDDVQGTPDMDAAMIRMLSAVVAADDDVALCKSAEQAAVTARRDAETMRDTLRAALEEALSETGCPAVVSGHHIAELREGRPSVVVTDPDALPDEMCRIRREPDKRALAAALAKGAVSGASLNNARAVLAVRSKEPVKA